MKLYQEDMCKLHINYLKCSTAERTHSSVYTQTTLLQVKGAYRRKPPQRGLALPGIGFLFLSAQSGTGLTSPPSMHLQST